MLSQEKQKAIIEALLFVSTQPVPINKMIRRLRAVERAEQSDQSGQSNMSSQPEQAEQPDQAEQIEELEYQEEDVMQQLMQKQQELDSVISASDIKRLLKEIEEELQKDEHGYELVTVAKGYQFRTKYDISEFLKDEKIQAPSRFSPSSLETLAIIAYQQPITRQKIEDIRGVDSGGVLKTLLDKGILRVVGRSEEPGKPLIYGTSKKFLEIFSLNSLKDLPSLQDYHSLQLSQDKEELLEVSKNEDEIFIDDLIDDDMEELSDAERAVLDDLDSSLKNLKEVEKEVIASQKSDESEAVVQESAEISNQELINS